MTGVTSDTAKRFSYENTAQSLSCMNLLPQFHFSLQLSMDGSGAVVRFQPSFVFLTNHVQFYGGVLHSSLTWNSFMDLFSLLFSGTEGFPLYLLLLV